MSETSGRLLALLSLLQTPREWPGSELARRLGVTPRTVRRDVDRLRDLGYPVEATLGAAGGYRLVAGAALPPLLLDDEEAVAIAVGLRAAAGSAVAGIEEASVRALGKLEQVLPARLRHRVRSLGVATLPVGGGPMVDPEVLTALAAAVATRERVRFRYTSGDGEQSGRLVEPLALVPSGRRWYLVGWNVEWDVRRNVDRDIRRGAGRTPPGGERPPTLRAGADNRVRSGSDGDYAGWRTYRVDRIARVQPTGVRIREEHPLPADDAAAYVAGRRTDWGTPELRVVVDFDAPVGAVAGRLGDGPGQVVAVDDARSRLDARRDDSMEWLASRLVALGCDFTVEAPPALTAAVRALAGRAAAAVAVRPNK
ncbi:helix-turn-helix transcriptional regulator [Jiangella alkaliphila]|uniref:Predicted DNA-binding transcriptional regulator YafY, contains an HTH and WYL domains n=1 Tax=Jiangella alkaliphila TaxID=419479 RepID=A0A1H2HSQ8_9ACTN|nr:WYL domain-containing protein [Jiangella alkaliphila]SDU34867.1 Predicted DNA-binding transcriptional regulator YafY, contains an HTH and WYL domains [Jiangella alkaliphila]